MYTVKLSRVCRAPHDDAGGGGGAEIVGQTLAGRYRVESRIGAGPLGVVYRAEDTEQHRPVAVKVFAADITPDGEEARRLLADLETASGLMNPHIVPPLDAGTTRGRLFVVEPLLAGQSLAHRIAQEGEQAPLDTVRYALEVLVALDALHRHHILHLDLKPQNIFVVRDPLGMERVLVSGVGQQHALALDNAPARSGGETRATPEYLAPEIVSGKPRDMRTDLYQLGLVIYEALCGRPPFVDDPPAKIARRHVLERPPSPKFVREGSAVPDTLDLIVVQCLEKVARKRYSSAGEMTRALEQVAQKGTPSGGRFRGSLAVTSRPPAGLTPPPFADMGDEPPPEGPITRLDVRKVLDPASDAPQWSSTPKLDAPPQWSSTPKVSPGDLAALRTPRNTDPIASGGTVAEDEAPAPAAAPAAPIAESGRTLVDPLFRPPPRAIAPASDDDDDNTGAFDQSAFPGAALDAVELEPRGVDSPAARAATAPVSLDPSAQTVADGAPRDMPRPFDGRRDGPLGAWKKHVSAPPGGVPPEDEITAVDRDARRLAAGGEVETADTDRTAEHARINDEAARTVEVESPGVAAASSAAAAEAADEPSGDVPAATPDGDWSVGAGHDEDTLDPFPPRRPTPALPFVIGALALVAVAVIFLLPSGDETADASAGVDETARVAVGDPTPVVAPDAAPPPDAAVVDAAPTAADVQPPDAAPAPDAARGPDRAALARQATRAYRDRTWSGSPEALAETLAALRAIDPDNAKGRDLAERGANILLRDSRRALDRDDFAAARAAVATAQAISPGYSAADRQNERIDAREKALAAEQARAERQAAERDQQRAAAREAAAEQKADAKAAREARAREEAEAARRAQAEAEARARENAAQQAAAEQKAAERDARRAEATAAIGRGRAELKAAKYDAAKGAFEEALRKNPNAAAAHAGLGEVAFQQQRFADAVTHHRNAVQASPRNVGYQIDLGMAYYRLKNYAQAKSWWEKALTLQPTNAKAKKYLDLVEKKLAQ